MTQRDRDRLVALKKARKGLITQRQVAEEIGQSERHVRRLLKRLKCKGDAALVHALRGRRSNRKLGEKAKQKALEIPAGGLQAEDQLIRSAPQFDGLLHLAHPVMGHGLPFENPLPVQEDWPVMPVARIGYIPYYPAL